MPDLRQSASADHSGAALIAVRHTNNVIGVRLAHPQCSPSTVLTLLREHHPSQQRVHATCWLYPAATTLRGGASKPLAVLVISTDVRAIPRTQAREAPDRYTQALRDAGFITVDDVRDLHGLQDVNGPDLRISPANLRARIDLDRVHDAPSRVEVSLAAGVLFAGDLTVPPAWHAAARAADRILVLTGTAITIGPTPAPRRTAPAGIGDRTRTFLTHLETAARDGRVLGALAPLTPTRQRLDPDPLEPQQSGSGDHEDAEPPRDLVAGFRHDRRRQGLRPSAYRMPRCRPLDGPCSITAAEASGGRAWE